MDRLPIYLDLQNRPCLVVGGGVIAERKSQLLLRCGASVSVLAPKITKDLRKLSKQGKISHISQSIHDTDITDFWLIVAATDDHALNKNISFSAESAGKLCNVVDNNKLSTFILPAIVDRSPVIIAIGTEGNAPVLAQKLKTEIESWLPTRIGQLAKQAGRWRQLVKNRYETLQERRHFWRNFFSGPIADHLLSGRQILAEKLMRSELIGEANEKASNQGQVSIVGAGPGDPGLITLHAKQLISQSDVILYDELVSAPILDFARKEADLIPVGKRSGTKGMQQEQINHLLVNEALKGKRVCRLKGGDPFIFGRGGEEVLALSHAGLPYQIVPGISAAIGCAAYAGLPLTLRGISSSVTFATAKLENEIPQDWIHLLKAGHTLAIYMGVKSIETISSELINARINTNLPVCIIENGTTKDQRLIMSTLGKVVIDTKDAQLNTPAIIYIGETVKWAEKLQWFDGQSEAEKFSSWSTKNLAKVI